MENLERVIVADPNGNAWGFANDIYEKIKKIEKEDGYENFVLRELKITEFPDGEFEPIIESNVRLRSVIFIHDSNKRPSRWLTELLLVNDAAVRASAMNITDVLPYMRWSRGDKKDKPHIPVSFKVVANAITKSLEHAPQKRIITMDLHSEQTKGFFDFPVDCLESRRYIIEHLIKNHYDWFKESRQVAPDHGSAENVGKFAEISTKKLNLLEELEIAIIDKIRVSGDETKVRGISGKELVCQKRVLMLDDIYATGGTLVTNTKELKKEGAADVWDYVTHPVFVGKWKENLEKLDKLLVTDTVYQDYSGIDNVEIVSVVPLFARAIYNSESGKSINELFS